MLIEIRDGAYINPKYIVSINYTSESDDPEVLSAGFCWHLRMVSEMYILTIEQGKELLEKLKKEN